MRVASQIKNTLSIALILAFGLFLTACASTKITDPNDPRFDVTQLRLEGFYKGKKELCEALRIILPPGTDKEYVDYVLIEIGGAKAAELIRNSTYVYQYISDLWHYNNKVISIVYSPNMKVKKVCGHDIK